MSDYAYIVIPITRPHVCGPRHPSGWNHAIIVTTVATQAETTIVFKNASIPYVLDWCGFSPPASHVLSNMTLSEDEFARVIESADFYCYE